MRVDELFGIFRNNQAHDKAKEAREKLKKDTADMVAKHRAKKAGQKPDDDEDEEDPKKKAAAQTRSGSTKGTQSTRSAAGGRAAERDWTNNL